MERLIPGLALLLAAGAIAFFVMPAMAPTVLIGCSTVVLAIALYFHYSQFGVMEYERSTWQYNLRKYSSYVMFGVIILAAYGFYAMNQSSYASGSSSGGIMSSIASPSMPALSAPIIGGSLSAMGRTAASRIQELMRRGRISID